MSDTDLEAPEPTEIDTVEASPEPSHDEDNRLTRDFVDTVVEHVEQDENEEARALVRPLHPADIADLFELAPADARAPLASALAELLDGDVLAEMNDWVRDEVLQALSARQVAALATELDTDDAVAIIEDMDLEDQREVLRALDPDDRAAIEEALSYPEESAGRLMQRDLIAVPEHWTVGDVLDYLRRNEDLTTDFWEIYVTDHAHHPVGTCKLSWVLRTPRSIAIADVMQREQTLIPVDMDQEEVALRFQKYALISAAVVDAAGRLVGMITVDDVLHIIQQEAGEDILAMSGAGDGDINEPLRRTIRSRMLWLLINLGTAILAASVIGAFSGAIEKLVALSALMTIVSGMGGNAATQTMAVTVRALATNQLTSSNTWRMIGREWWISVANGVGLGALMTIGCQVYYHDTGLSAILFAAMVINSINAGLAGVLIPLGLEKLKIDPAVTSTVFVTTMTDCMGFFALLGLATAFNVS
ncbi:magnesium transporter [Sphingomonas oryzagri]|uniref:Magnesium transporter MgtE n=1 Tax=Sphingomonas oryzagri TaxID=3042314 RepID=A0ABT6N5E6_9SPHN|nr:magnesium transporter [Sphingomonas oryzagri]MDH7640325.1 magnesium transporter [Sphingomonas oryzagri]